MATTTTPLRERMIGDMQVRNMAPLTQRAYVRSVKNFSAFFGRSPDKLTFEDVRSYRLHLMSRGAKPQTINQIVSALRFFYSVTLRMPEAKLELPLARRADILPAALAVGQMDQPDLDERCLAEVDRRACQLEPIILRGAPARSPERDRRQQTRERRHAPRSGTFV